MRAPDRLKDINFAGIALVLALAGAAVPGAKANVSICDQVAGNLIQNCGFENGVYSSTLGGNTNNTVPVDWVPGSAFDLEMPFNYVSGKAHSGNSALSMGNLDYQPLASLSQTFSDTAGISYSATFFAYDGGATIFPDPNAFLAMQLNGVTQVFLTQAVASYKRFGFTFTGTGSDTLMVAGQTNPGEWNVDDIVVISGSASTPEPSEIAPLALGLVLLIASFRKSRIAQQLF